MAGQSELPNFDSLSDKHFRHMLMEIAEDWPSIDRDSVAIFREAIRRLEEMNK